jgi:OmpA-OmpF porin, OOP family
MPDSYFSPLSSVLSSSAIQNIAGHFGVPEQTILGGVHSSMAAIVSGLAQRSNDRGFVGQLAQMASSTPENSISSALSSDALTNPNSASVSGGSQMLNSVFGGRLGSLTNAISGQTGLGSMATSSLLALSGTTVLGLIGKKLRDGSLNANSLPGFLQNESSSLQGYVPRGFGAPAPVAAYQADRDPVIAQKIDIDPVIAQSVRRERQSILPWLLPLLLAALLLGFWGLRPRRVPVAVVTRPPVPVAPPPTVMSTTGTDLGSMVPVKACDGTDVQAPQRGVEGRLVAFIVDPARAPDRTTWFDFDRLLFDTDSANLQPQSTAQLTDIAQILQHCPNVRMRVGGYTDNTGDARHNMVLSQQRADSVCSQLEAMGISPDRLSAKGYGDTHPVADNSTPDGRALNRRISMLVIQK